MLPLQNKNKILKTTFIGIKSCCRKSNSKSYNQQRFLFLELLVFREINKKFREYKNQIQNKSTGTPKNIKSSSEKNRFRRKKKVNPCSEKRVQKLSHLNPFCFFFDILFFRTLSFQESIFNFLLSLFEFDFYRWLSFSLLNIIF